MSYWTVALFIVISIIICVFLYTHKDNMYTNVCRLASVSLHSCRFWKIQKHYTFLQLKLNVQYLCVGKEVNVETII